MTIGSIIRHKYDPLSLGIILCIRKTSGLGDERYDYGNREKDYASILWLKPFKYNITQMDQDYYLNFLEEIK